MGEVRFDIGAVADLALGSDVESIHGKLDRMMRHMGRRDPRPIYNDVPASGIGVAGVATVVRFGGPASGRVWDIRQLVMAGSDDRTSGGNGSTVGVAAAGGTLTVPAGAALAGFTINIGPAAAAVTGVVTVTGSASGTLSYQLSDGTNGGSLTVNYTPPLQPAAPGTSIVITVPAIATGGAYTIDAQWVYPVAWYKSMSDNAGLAQLLVPGTFTVPGTVVPASAESVFIHFGEQVTALVYGLPAGQQVTGVVRVADWPDSIPEGMVV